MEAARLTSGIPDDIAAQFAADVRSAGEELFLTRRVQQFELAGSTVSARTGARQKFRVFLTPGPGGLALKCRCPGYRITRLRCEHMWAVLLEAVQRGLFEHLLGDRAGAQAESRTAAVPAGSEPREVRGVPQPCAEVRSQWVKALGHSAPVLRVLFEYEGVRVPAAPRLPVTQAPEELAIVHRDLEAEDGRLRELDELRLGARTEAQVVILRARFAGAVSALIERGWLVAAEGKRYRPARRTSATVTSGVDWFDISGDVVFDGLVVPLPAALRSLRRNHGFVPLGDGSFGVLPEAWLHRFKALEEASAPDAEGLRFARCQHGLIDELLGHLPDSKFDEAFVRLREALRATAHPRPTTLPGFRGELRDYQREGVAWLLFLDEHGLGGCLADDMGLGKTVQVLALLAGRHAGGTPRPPSLVVVPRSLVDNWVEEAARFAPDLRVMVHHGTDRARNATAMMEHHLVVTTYGTLRRDIPWLREFTFEHVVLDEGQAIKNPSTDAYRAARQLACRRRVLLSGTPLENHLGELLTLMDFLNPGMFGPKTLLARAARQGGQPDAALLGALRAAIRPLLLRRTKLAVERELPARTELTLHCHLESAQRTLYDQLREHYRTTLLGPTSARSPALILEALLRLRQVACHPGLLEPSLRAATSAKLEALVPSLVEIVAAGHKALVFSQFTSLLALVRERLEREGVTHEYLDGAVRDRASRVKRFQEDPAVSIFLISLRAGGVGLNLTAAEYVYILDPWWNPAVEAQAVDRAHRIGQLRPVVAYRLVARDTVEDRILELQARKRRLADAILSEESGALAGLTHEDLERLLS